MQVIFRLRGPFRWRTRSGLLLPTNSSERLRRLGNAALATQYYSQAQRAGQILGASALEELPALPIRELLEQRRSFLNPKAPQTPCSFRNPLPAPLKTSVVGLTMQVNMNVRVFSAARWEGLQGTHTQLLAATVPVLRRMVAGVLNGSFALPSLTHGIVVLNSVEQGTLLSAERELIWRIFGVPLFEQWLGLDGEVLASECEAHRGMHLEDDSVALESSDSGEIVMTSFDGLRTPTLRLHTGLTARIETEECACGLNTPRLLELRPMEPRLVLVDKAVEAVRQHPSALHPTLSHQSSPERFPPGGYLQTRRKAVGAA